MISYHTCPLAQIGKGQAGGLNVYVKELARELGRRGALIDIYTRQASPRVDPVVTIAQGVRVHHVSAGPAQDIPKDALVTYVPDFARALQVSLFEQAYDIVHSHYWLSGRTVMEAGVPGRLPWVHMAHTWGHLKDRSLGFRSLSEHPERLHTEAKIARRCDLLIASTSKEKLFATWSYGVDPDRIRVVPCGIDTELFSPGDRDQARRELGLNVPGTLLAFVGRLDPIKGLEVLLKAVHILRQNNTGNAGVSLMVVGGEATPGEAGRLAGLAEQMGIADLVTFTGPVPHHQLPLYYRAADIAVMPSLYESFGMALLEAMACGAPVVATKVDGPSNFLRHGVTGLLVPPGDPLALAEALSQLIGDKHMRRQLASNALATVVHYRWEAVAQAILSAYADALCPVGRQRFLTAV